MGEGMSTDDIGVGGEDKRVNRLGNGATSSHHDHQSSRLNDIRHQGASAILSAPAPQTYRGDSAYRQMRLSGTMREWVRAHRAPAKWSGESPYSVACIFVPIRLLHLC